ncbi:MAG TPA: cytochrome P450, partial [Baekduia sp.]|nr:cytochrome P450 [Baekduia sp.]
MPAALQAWEWTRAPLPFLGRCRHRFGDAFTLRISHSGTWVVLSDPEDVKRVFTADPATMGASQASAVIAPLLGRRSVMLLDEPDHLTRRRIILPPFHGRRMAGYAGMTAAVARREVDRWPVGESFELWPRMQSITLDVILNVVFGEDAETNPRLRRVRVALERMTVWLNDPRRLAVLAVLGPRWIAGHRGFARTREEVADAVLDEVRLRRGADAHGSEGSDMISLLLEGRYEDGSPLTDRDLADELITLLSDGPTSTSLAWAFERLLRHPDKLELLRDEVLAGEDDIYMEAVIRETLRLCPPVPVVVRKLLAPLELNSGHLIPAGTTVAPCVSLMHHREDIYPEPEAFRPERFLGVQPGTYTWIPFGGGVRRCLAASFAIQEMKQVLGTVLAQVDLHAVGAGSERVARSSIAF